MANYGQQLLWHLCCVCVCVLIALHLCCSMSCATREVHPDDQSDKWFPTKGEKSVLRTQMTLVGCMPAEDLAAGYQAAAEAVISEYWKKHPQYGDTVSNLVTNQQSVW